MIRVPLSDSERRAVQALRRCPTLRPAERDRVEMVLLSAAGWSPPAIAQHLGYCAVTVRRVLKSYRTIGTAALHRARPGPPPNEARRSQVTSTLLVPSTASRRAWSVPVVPNCWVQAMVVPVGSYFRTKASLSPTHVCRG